MLDLERAEVGGQVGARARLAVPLLGRIEVQRQVAGRAALAGDAVVDDRARQARDVGVVIDVVQLNHRLAVEVIVARHAGQGAVQVAVVGPALAITLGDIQAQTEAVVRPEAAAGVQVLGEDAVGIVALGELDGRPLGGALELVVEHAGRRRRAVERAGQAVHHLDAAQHFRRGGRGANDAEAVDPGCLGHRALEAAGLGPGNLVALLVAHLH